MQNSAQKVATRGKKKSKTLCFWSDYLFNCEEHQTEVSLKNVLMFATGLISLLELHQFLALCFWLVHPSQWQIHAQTPSGYHTWTPTVFFRLEWILKSRSQK